MRRRNWSWTIAWSSLLVVGISIGVFGVFAAVVPTSDDEALMRADGVASLGVAVFGVMITVFAFRSRQRWAWFALWFYPAFWLAHLIGRLPPGKDHIHQIVLLLLSLAGLLLAVREFFPRSP
jgi:polyferredoxin